MEKKEKSKFEQLAALDVSGHIEKKGGMSYLSWSWAVDQLLRIDSAANWCYHEPVMFGETMMVSCTVTAFEKSMTMHLPVMDYKNKAIKNPDAFDINKAMMRCLVKAIALHGLGLYIYAGEDLPLEAEPRKTSKPEGTLTVKQQLAAEVKKKDLTETEEDEFRDYIMKRKLAPSYVLQNLSKIMNDWWVAREDPLEGIPNSDEVFDDPLFG